MTANTTTQPADAKPARMPNAKTADARLREAGIQHDGTPKGRRAAWDAWVAAGRPAAEAKPAATKPKPAPATQPAFPLCACGCGVPTVTAKARFLSGHDARFAGRYGRGEITLTEEQAAVLAASPALQAKVDGIIKTHAKRLAAKAAREAAKAAAKRAYDEAMASVR